MKICVIGYSGAGKSTLAEILGKKYNIPVLHLDATYWYGNWEHRSRAEQSEIVNKFMAENQSWVIDGNYRHICPERFSLCDEIYFLNYNRFFCFNEAVKRYKKYKGKVRPDCPCIEKFDAEFAFWILFKSRTPTHKKMFKQFINACNGKVHIFKTRKKLNGFLERTNG